MSTEREAEAVKRFRERLEDFAEEYDGWFHGGVSISTATRLFAEEVRGLEEQHDKLLRAVEDRLIEENKALMLVAGMPTENEKPSAEKALASTRLSLSEELIRSMRAEKRADELAVAYDQGLEQMRQHWEEENESLRRERDQWKVEFEAARTDARDAGWVQRQATAERDKAREALQNLLARVETLLASHVCNEGHGEACSDLRYLEDRMREAREATSPSKENDNGE